MELNPALFENIMNSVSEAICVLDRNGNVSYLNNAMVQLLGYSKQEGITLNTFTMYKTGMLSTHIFKKLLDQKKTVTTCERILKKDQTRSAYYLVTHTPIFDEFGGVKYSVVTVRDVERLYEIYKGIPKNEDTAVLIAGQKAIVKQFIFQSSAMKKVVAIADHVAQTDANILIQGESGTGKEVLAAYIHAASPRSQKDMVVINCAALPENLLEAELFGYEKGAFTGAQHTGKQGLIELADHGTLFLDEIDSIPYGLQGKLLRVLECKEVRRLGGVSTKMVDFRLLSATNANLFQSVAEKRFRADLLYRIGVIPLGLPPLRERLEDLKPLAEHFLSYYFQKYNCKKTLSEHTYEKLLQYRWPGNIRELKNFLERVVLMTDTAVEQIDDVSFDLIRWERSTPNLPVNHDTSPIAATGPNPPTHYDCSKPLRDQVADYELQLIDQAIIQFGSLSKAAEALGTTKNTLIRKRKR